MGLVAIDGVLPELQVLMGFLTSQDPMGVAPTSPICQPSGWGAISRLAFQGSELQAVACCFYLYFVQR